MRNWNYVLFTTQNVFSCVKKSIFTYRIYSINRPGRLLNFWTLRVGAYSRWAVIQTYCVNNKQPLGEY